MKEVFVIGKGAIKFKAWDKLNKVPIRLFKILISSEGSVIAVEDINGEVYGMHQAELVIEE